MAEVTRYRDPLWGRCPACGRWVPARAVPPVPLPRHPGCRFAPKPVELYARFNPEKQGWRPRADQLRRFAFDGPSGPVEIRANEKKRMVTAEFIAWARSTTSPAQARRDVEGRNDAAVRDLLARLQAVPPNVCNGNVAARIEAAEQVLQDRSSDREAWRDARRGPASKPASRPLGVNGVVSGGLPTLGKGRR